MHRRTPALLMLKEMNWFRVIVTVLLAFIFSFQLYVFYKDEKIIATPVSSQCEVMLAEQTTDVAAAIQRVKPQILPFMPEGHASDYIPKSKLPDLITFDTGYENGSCDQTVTVAFNPLMPPELRLAVTRSVWRGVKEGDVYLRDWLGIKVNVSFDCQQQFSGIAMDKWAGYEKYVPSRVWPCHWFRQLRVGDTYPGCMPVVDDEYPEYIDVLNSVLLADPDKPYTFVELGGRYSTWAVRAGTAFRKVHGADKDVKLIVVEPTTPADCEHHCKVNGFDCYVHNGFIGGGRNNVDLFALLDQAGAGEYINAIDADIQGAEAAVFTAAAIDKLTKRVFHVHIGTHGTAIHSNLKAAFLQAGWLLTIDLPWGYQVGGGACDSLVKGVLQRNPQCYLWTPYGAIYVRDGLLGFVNPFLYGNKVMYMQT